MHGYLHKRWMVGTSGRYSESLYLNSSSRSQLGRLFPGLWVHIQRRQGTLVVQEQGGNRSAGQEGALQTGAGWLLLRPYPLLPGLVVSKVSVVPPPPPATSPPVPSPGLASWSFFSSPSPSPIVVLSLILQPVDRPTTTAQPFCLSIQQLPASGLVTLLILP